ncbi:MAG: trypsin-like peptidase domain-containing protein [Planctomycetota bacterium]|jgi:S1-C subfamily serine protease
MESGSEERPVTGQGAAPREEGAREEGAGKDVLLSFLATLSVALLGLLVLLRLFPERFGARELFPSPAEPSRLEPRPAMTGPADAPRPVVPRRPAAPTQAQVVFSDASPSVVHVTTRTRDVRERDFDAAEFISGTGSGWVWDREGHVVTCLHVVNGATSALVTLADGSEWEAKLVGVDPRTDLAVVRIDAPEEQLVPVRMGSSADLSVGAQVFSVSCPYGLAHSLSVGHLSGLGRRIRSESGQYIDGVLQTDAAMHPGSSGGTLLDDQGRVIGMNAAIHADSRQQTGVGFALPIDRAQEAVPAILRDGFRWEPRFGFVTASDASSEALLGKISGVPEAPVRGVVVAEVDEGSPAALAGLRAMQTTKGADLEEQLIVRDVIVGAEGRAVGSRADLEAALRGLAPGAPLTLRVATPSGESEVVLTPAPAVDSGVEPTAPPTVGSGR